MSEPATLLNSVPRAQPISGALYTTPLYAKRCWVAVLLLSILPGCGDASEGSGGIPGGVSTKQHADSGVAGKASGTGGSGDVDPEGSIGGSGGKGSNVDAAAPLESSVGCVPGSCPAGQTCDTKSHACIASDGCSVDDIAAAASTLITFVQSKKRLPGDLTACSQQVSMPSFLALSATAVLKINDDAKEIVKLKEYDQPSAPKDNITKGSLKKSEYVDIAGRLMTFMAANSRAPNFVSNTSVGSELGYENLVYAFSKVLDDYLQSGSLPESVALDPALLAKSADGQNEWQTKNDNHYHPKTGNPPATGSCLTGYSFPINQCAGHIPWKAYEFSWLNYCPHCGKAGTLAIEKSGENLLGIYCTVCDVDACPVSGFGTSCVGGVGNAPAGSCTPACETRLTPCPTTPE